MNPEYFDHPVAPDFNVPKPDRPYIHPADAVVVRLGAVDRAFPRLTPAARHVLRKVPYAGSGLHPWIFRAVRILKNCLTDDDIRKAVAIATMHCGRDTTREVEEAIRGCKPSDEPFTPHIDLPAMPQWPDPNEALVKSLAPVKLSSLEDMSPVRWTNTIDGVYRLFTNAPGDDPDPLLCCAMQPRSARTMSFRGWRSGLMSMSLIVPSVMTSVMGVNLAGKPSYRCLSNTGPRRFLVCEFDTGNFMQQAAVIMKLREALPLTLIVHSGGKSLHTWWRVSHLTEEQHIEFFRTACTLGADPATWTRCQLVRLPGGLRDRTTLQKVLYYAPDAAL